MSAATPLPEDVDDLRRRAAGGTRFRYAFFWRHHRQPDGSLGAGCFSQWWPAPFVVDGVRYATAEHYMMAGKARLFGDDTIAAQVLVAPSPGAAQALGRRVRGFDQEVWDAHRFDLVVAGNMAKFGQHPELRDYLLGTRDRVLVEASPIDRIWGIGLAATDPRAADPTRWRGLNLLGFALMRVRRQLMAAAPA
ncbi:NADAR family protein [Micromonospora sp. HM5-17]|uniref:NADAR family protein n=1 Tax=Micromonospora sp. HM5-17 TaxID=2487710 RepID=UPI000F482919|nr:NADAR family protein [Micromonospora sp. HM5-17]ROT32593.1 NADAR family protein [Micromonospora sp. HM5-17]